MEKNNALESFLNNSEIAKAIDLPAKIILEERSLTPAKIVAIKESGIYSAWENGEKVCDFVVGGETLVGGEIIKKGNEYFFKVKEVYSNEVIK